MPDFRNIEVTFSPELIKKYVEWHLETFPYALIYPPFYQNANGSEFIIANPTEDKVPAHQQAISCLFRLFSKSEQSPDGSVFCRLKVTRGLGSSLSPPEEYAQVVQDYLQRKSSVPYDEAPLRKLVRWFKETYEIAPVYSPLAIDEFATVTVENPNSPDAQQLSESARNMLVKAYKFFAATPKNNLNLRITGTPFNVAYDILEHEDSQFVSFDQATKTWLYKVPFNKGYIERCHKWWVSDKNTKVFLVTDEDSKTKDIIVRGVTESARELRRLYNIDERFDLLLVGSAVSSFNTFFDQLTTTTTPPPSLRTVSEPLMPNRVDVLGQPIEEAQKTLSSNGWWDTVKGFAALPTPADFQDTKYVQGLVHGAAGMMALSKFPEIQKKIDWLTNLLSSTFGGAIKNFAKAVAPEDIFKMALQAAPQEEHEEKVKTPTKQKVKAGK